MVSLVTYIQHSIGDLRIIDRALELAKRSTHPQHRLGSVIVKGGSVLGVGYNEGHFKKCAERKALRAHSSYVGAVLYVIRQNKRMSRPCKNCAKLIRDAGIKSVI